MKLWNPKDRVWRRKVLRVAVVMAIVALLMMVYSFLDPHPLPMVVFMTVGQGIGTLSFVIFLVIVAIDLVQHGVIGPDIADDEPAREVSDDEGASSGEDEP